MLVRQIAHARTGDKGNRSTLSVIAFDAKDYPRLEAALSCECVKAHFGDVVQARVERYCLPHLGALNFVLYDALGGGVTRSLALDAHGKCLASRILGLELPDV